MPILICTLLAAMPVAADQTELRYRSAGTLELRVEQDMYPSGRADPIADRRFDMTFDFSDSANIGEWQAELSAVRASYSAHGMNQILSSRHLVGQQTRFLSDGKAVVLDDPGGDIDLGFVTDGGFRPSAALVDVMPILPDGPVSKDTTWSTTQKIESLEGWAWAKGEIAYAHRVTGIDEIAGRQIVSVESQGEAKIAAATGREGFVGEGAIERRITWTFDATAGQLLSLSLQQEGTGTNQLPQGVVEVRQVTRIELNSG